MTCILRLGLVALSSYLLTGCGTGATTTNTDRFTGHRTVDMDSLIVRTGTEPFILRGSTSLKSPPLTLIRFYRNNGPRSEWVRCHNVDLLVDGKPLQPLTTKWEPGQSSGEAVLAAFDASQVRQMANATTIEFRVCSVDEDIDGSELQAFQRFLQESVRAMDGAL